MYFCILIYKWISHYFKKKWRFGLANGFYFYTRYPNWILDGLIGFYPMRPDYLTRTNFFAHGSDRIFEFTGWPVPVHTSNFWECNCRKKFYSSASIQEFFHFECLAEEYSDHELKHNLVRVRLAHSLHRMEFLTNPMHTSGNAIKITYFSNIS